MGANSPDASAQIRSCRKALKAQKLLEEQPAPTYDEMTKAKNRQAETEDIERAAQQAWDLASTAADVDQATARLLDAQKSAQEAAGHLAKLSESTPLFYVPKAYLFKHPNGSIFSLHESVPSQEAVCLSEDPKQKARQIALLIKLAEQRIIDPAHISWVDGTIILNERALACKHSKKPFDLFAIFKRKSIKVCSSLSLLDHLIKKIPSSRDTIIALTKRKWTRTAFNTGCSLVYETVAHIFLAYGLGRLVSTAHTFQQQFWGCLRPAFLSVPYETFKALRSPERTLQDVVKPFAEWFQPTLLTAGLITTPLSLLKNCSWTRVAWVVASIAVSLLVGHLTASYAGAILSLAILKVAQSCFDGSLLEIVQTVQELTNLYLGTAEAFSDPAEVAIPDSPWQTWRKSVQKDGFALKDAPEELRNNLGIVALAVQNQGLALQYASQECKKQLGVILFAVQQNPDAFQYADDTVKADQKLVCEYVQKNGHVLQHVADPLKNDPAVVREALTSTAYALQYASDELKNDKDLVMLALLKNGCALKYAADLLKNDKDIVRIAALSSQGRALQYASCELLQDDSFVDEMLQTYPNAFSSRAELLSRHDEWAHTPHIAS